MIAGVLMPLWCRIRRIDYNAFRAEMSCGASKAVVWREMLTSAPLAPFYGPPLEFRVLGMPSRHSAIHTLEIRVDLS